MDPLLQALVLFPALWAMHHRLFGYSPLALGVFRRVFRTPVRDGGERCADCHESFEYGERRRWGRDVVVFGFLIHAIEDGRREYCLRHADVTIQDELRDEPAGTTAGDQPRALRALLAITETTVEHLNEDDQDDHPFANVTTSVTSTASAALTLAVVGLMVILANSIVDSVQGELEIETKR